MRCSTVLLLVFVAPLLSCAPLTELDQAAYDTSSQLAPTHPVYGTPIFNLVPEEQEIAAAKEAWAQIETAAKQAQVAIDPAGERLDQIRIVFQRLVAVAHRQQLPWEVHLLAAKNVNAGTYGGGLVVVFDGLFGGLVEPGDQAELAAVLAHEVAHVTLLHVPTRTTWDSFANLIDGRRAQRLGLPRRDSGGPRAPRARAAQPGVSAEALEDAFRKLTRLLRTVVARTQPRGTPDARGILERAGEV